MNLGFYSGYTKKKILLFCIVFSLVGNLFSYGYFYFTKNGYPLLSFMTSPVGRFDDFYNNLFAPNEFLKTKANFTMYPLSNLLYKFFSINNVNLSAFIFFVLMSAFLFWSFSRLNVGLLFLALVFVSYPYHFTIARGNNEIFLVGIAALIFSSFIKQEFFKSFKYLMILFLIEPYPFYILIVFLYSKVALIKSIRLAIFVSFILSVFLFNDTILSYFKTLILDGSGYITSAGPGSTLNSSSLSGLIQYGYLSLTGQFPYQIESFILLNRIIPLLGSIVLILFFIKYRKLIDRVTASTLIVSGWTLLSGSSFDYRLLHFFIPLAIIITTAASKFDYLLIALIMLLFVPKPFLLFVAENNSIGATLGSVINPIIVLIIVLITLFHFYRIKLSQPEKIIYN